MPRKKNDLNTIYISERLQEKLRPISRCTLTTVIAPMGYGKTTAVNWYLNERVKKDHGVVIASAFIPITFRFSGKACRMPFGLQVLTFLRNMSALRIRPAAVCLQMTSATFWQARQIIIFLLTIFIFLRMQGSVNSSVHYQGGSRKMFIW